MKLYTLRLRGEDDLRDYLQGFAKVHNITAGFIISCAGALKVLRIRMAGATKGTQIVKQYSEDFEIVSLSGTIEAADCHLHIAAARRNGSVIGGHLKEGTIVDITAEIVIGVDDTNTYTRELDPATGFDELLVQPRMR